MGEERVQSAIPKEVGLLEEIEKNCTTLHNILQLKWNRGLGTTEKSAGTRTNVYGKQEGFAAYFQVSICIHV